MALDLYRVKMLIPTLIKSAGKLIQLQAKLVGGECTASYSPRTKYKSREADGAEVKLLSGGWFYFNRLPRKYFDFWLIYYNITYGAMVSRKHWLRMPLDIKQGENIRLTVCVGLPAISPKRTKTDQKFCRR